MAWFFRGRRSANGDKSCRLSREQLGQLFPFHARLEANGRLHGLGPALAKLGGRPGANITELITLESPPELSLEQLLADPDLAFGRPLLFRRQPRSNPEGHDVAELELSGELLSLNRYELLLVLSPRVDTIADLNSAGLSSNDLALHDSLRCRLLTGSMEAGLHELVQTLKHQSGTGN
jgi:hypothetical protein